MKFYEAKVKEIKKETSDTYSFIMDIPEGFSWKAGQHVLWKLKDYKVPEGEKDSRVFTIASAPEDGFLMFTTRITELHSGFKDILLNKIQPGDIIMVATPLGNFTLDAEDYAKTLIIAGGIGITPIRSLLRSYMEHPIKGHQITLLYSDDRGEYAYEDFWKELKEKLPDIELNFLTTREEFTCMTDGFAGDAGDDAEYLVAGSPGMNTAFTERLTSLGIDSGNVKTDIFMGY
ncbi:ferredoxin--NADP reductase [Eubacterium sp. F2]|jgi:ferredoxin-NADP reductase|uniref:ferredoxin--NADP reductase n=1 Tax=Eubacterium sp. F2 TaxID=3381348 RepID=UPI003907F290